MKDTALRRRSPIARRCGRAESEGGSCDYVEDFPRNGLFDRPPIAAVNLCGSKFQGVSQSRLPNLVSFRSCCRSSRAPRKMFKMACIDACECPRLLHSPNVVHLLDFNLSFSGVAMSFYHATFRETLLTSLRRTISPSRSHLSLSNFAEALRPVPAFAIPIPAISIALPGIFVDVWEGILKAVPKKKTSYSKKRSRFLAGKALKDVTAVVECPGCRRPKKSHHLCPFCVAGELKRGTDIVGGKLTNGSRNQGELEDCGLGRRRTERMARSSCSQGSKRVFR